MGLPCLRRRLIANLVVASLAALLLLDSQPLPPHGANSASATRGVP
jgi:hypothetical protein